MIQYYANFPSTTGRVVLHSESLKGLGEVSGEVAISGTCHDCYAHTSNRDFFQRYKRAFKDPRLQCETSCSVGGQRALFISSVISNFPMEAEAKASTQTTG